MRRRFFNNRIKIPNTIVNNYLTIEALEDGLQAKLSVNACEYSLDGNTWNSLSAATNTPAVNAGVKIYFRGNLTPASSSGIGTFTISKKCNLKGNIMSLLYGDGFVGQTNLTSKNYAFYNLFVSCRTIIDASELILPATTLATSCYKSMFDSCTSLTTTPELPATKLANSCYNKMFRNCTSLTTAPELPATTLAVDCYYHMFNSCRSLTAAPELPATELSTNCYFAMFGSCTSLTAAPELPATELWTRCYDSMFSNCTSLTTAPELPATTLASYCYDSMFSGCTSLTTAPELPAIILASNCYSGMFYNCSKLNYIKMLATDISASNCLNNWVSGVASRGSFVKNAAMTSLPTGTSGIPSGWTVVNYVDYHTEYFTIEALEDGLTASLSLNACEYRIDYGSWNNLSTGSTTPTITAGQKIQFKMTNPTIKSTEGIGTFTISKSCNIEGNIMSLLYGDDFVGKTDLTGKKYAFYKLFNNCSTIVDASKLILPATTLANNCYQYMFYGCSSLITAPELPATTLAQYCYSSMFYNCSSLTTAPELPATRLERTCYSNMFSGCSSLTTAPELPATTLEQFCYQNMFVGCTSLTTAPELPSTRLVEQCYYYMFSGCSSLITAPELPATTLATDCYYSMFYGCTSLTTAPELPATTLASSCYYGMFRDCTSLTTAPELPATTLANNCYRYMFYNCTSLTTAPELPATTLKDYCYYGMFSGCSNLNYIKMLATDISATDCLNNWVYRVASNGTFIKHPDITTLSRGASGIPTGWTIEDNGEESV